MTTESKRTKTQNKQTPAPSLFGDELGEPKPLFEVEPVAEPKKVEPEKPPEITSAPKNETKPSDEVAAKPETTVTKVQDVAKPETAPIVTKVQGEVVAKPEKAVQSQSLYRKWRSQTFDELVGQDAITRTLQNAVASGKIAHAYLFCGPRGTGKTSSARLLAKAVNCLEPDSAKRPCNKCEPCRSIAEGRALDLIEIDAASNRGIDEIRDLRDKINYQPNQFRYKLYIIDEVHMLTEPAFNALLKTLEEPPAHAIFVLATTDPQDIPATVVSRCQRFDFQRINLEQSVARLAFICKEEDIKYERGALELIARQSTGSLRDAESLLDQLVVFSDGIIDVKTVQSLLGVMNTEAVANFVNALISGDMAAGLDNINKLVQSGADLKRFNRELVEYLRSLMLVKVNPSSAKSLELPQEAIEQMQSQSQQIELPTLVNLLKIFSQVDYNLKVSPYVQLPLEIALMEALLPSGNSGPQESRPVAPAPAPRPALTNRTTPPVTTPASQTTQPAPRPATPPKPTVSETVSSEPQVVSSDELADGELDFDKVKGSWPQLLNFVQNDNKSIWALLRESAPYSSAGNRVRLRFNYEFHCGKISLNQNRIYVEQNMSRLLGQNVIIECFYENQEKTAANEENQLTPEEDRRHKNITSILNARKID